MYIIVLYDILMKIDDKNNSGCGNVFWDVVTYKNMGEMGSIWTSRKDVGFTIKNGWEEVIPTHTPTKKWKGTRGESPHALPFRLTHLM